MSAAHDDAHGGGDGHGHGHSPWIQHHYDDAQHQFDSGKLGIWLFLAQEVLFFSALFVAYILYRHHHPEIYAYAHKYLDVKFGAINTAVLIFSSLTAAWAVRAAQLRQQRLLVACLAATLLCALTFLGIKYVEYTHKVHEHLLFGKYFDPCIGPNGQVLLTKNNECPGSKGTVVWNYGKEAPEIGCFPQFAIDSDPKKSGLQAECKVGEAEMTMIVENEKNDPIINPDTKTAMFFAPTKTTPIAKKCPPNSEAGPGSGEACWRPAYQPQVCRPGWFYAMRCSFTETRVDTAIEEKDTVANGAWKKYGPYVIAPGGDFTATLTGDGNVDLFVRKAEEPTKDKADPKKDKFDCRPMASDSNEECKVSGYSTVFVAVAGVGPSSNYKLTINYKQIAGFDHVALDYSNVMKTFDTTRGAVGDKKNVPLIAAAKKQLPDVFVASRCEKTEKYTWSQPFPSESECKSGRGKREGELKTLRDAEIEARCPKKLTAGERDACIKAIPKDALSAYEVGECRRAEQTGIVVQHHDHEVRPAKIAVTAQCKPPAKPGPEGDVYADKVKPLQVGAKAIGEPTDPEPGHHDHYAGPPPEHTNMFFTIYFAMTGLHGIHVLVGVFIFIWLLIRAIKGHFTPEYFGPVDWAALYWHIVDLIWIFLFPLMYLIH